MARAIEQSEKDSYLLVEFVYGDLAAKQYARYTDWTQSIGEYVATPTLAVKLPDNSGVFEEKRCTLALPLDAFTSPLISGSPHSPVYVKIREVTRAIQGGPEATNLEVFRGRVVSTVKNYQGRSDAAFISALPIKSRLSIPIGLPANHHCVWRIFGRGCGLVQSTFDRTGEITAISGKVVTCVTGAITAPSSPGGNVDRFWERGFLTKDGLAIGIHQWKLTNPTEFELVARPPSSWLMAGVNSITFVPGCHKTIEDCRAVWNNEEHFGGIGYAIPPYNPVFENPQ